MLQRPHFSVNNNQELWIIKARCHIYPNIRQQHLKKWRSWRAPYNYAQSDTFFFVSVFSRELKTVKVGLSSLQVSMALTHKNKHL